MTKTLEVLSREAHAKAWGALVPVVPDAQWNARYVEELDKIGFELRPVSPGEVDPTDSDGPIWAPAPQNAGWMYEWPCMIVPKGYKP